MKKRVSVAGVCLSAAFLAGCAQSQSNQLSDAPEIGISHQVLDAYNNEYLGTHTPIAFAVSGSGGAYDYYYCEAPPCAGGDLNSTQAISPAIARCNQRRH